ncbi:Nucleic acid-binding protein [Corchorus capsularis]|uniref:Nucleic acid-binding protein n=1 Tax=Corchorus capsularis TaxID=210143 RepID=A0A1R3G560_COCAP|nr:Nucleic acid-binding protein [Corchorus capsularis]
MASIVSAGAHELTIFVHEESEEQFARVNGRSSWPISIWNNSFPHAVQSEGSNEPVFTHLSSLKPGMRAFIIVRVCRLCETILPNGTVAVTTNLIIADEMGGFMQASLPQDLFHLFENILAEGNIYKVVRFQVVPWESNYNRLPSDHAIFFNSSIEVELLDQPADNFPWYYFDIADIDEISTKKEKDPLLTGRDSRSFTVWQAAVSKGGTEKPSSIKGVGDKIPTRRAHSLLITRYNNFNIAQRKIPAAARGKKTTRRP